jgi:septum formation protein
MKKIVLASKSIDRREILKQLKLGFEVLETDISEDEYKERISDPIELVEQLAKAKVYYAKEVLKRENKDSIIIAADTIVELNGSIMGKASNEQEAFQMIKKLAGKTHKLITGIAITETFTSKIIIDHDITVVHFLNLIDKEIWAYIKTDEWRGRAGAYSIREKASYFIDSIQGSFSNVIGLPVNKLYEILEKEFGIELLL